MRLLYRMFCCEPKPVSPAGNVNPRNRLAINLINGCYGRISLKLQLDKFVIGGSRFDPVDGTGCSLGRDG